MDEGQGGQQARRHTQGPACCSQLIAPVTLRGQLAVQGSSDRLLFHLPPVTCSYPK